MIENIISNENIIEREKNIFEKIILVVCMLSFIYIFMQDVYLVFFNKNKEVEICKLKCVESISHLAAMQF